MSFELALAVTGLISLIGNRILGVLMGLILRVPAVWLLPTVYLLDVLQIPFFYWLYENGSTLIARLPAPLRAWFGKEWSLSVLGRWTHSLGGAGVFLVATLS